MSSVTVKRAAKGKIGVICAPIPSINPGMVSVDLAFHALSQRHGFDEVEYFHLFDPAQYLSATPEIQEEKHHYYEDYPIRYQPLIGDQDRLLDCDVIIFWGDWTHMAVYCRDIIKPALIKLNICATEREASDLVSRYLFLSGQPQAVFDKTIVFGETLLFNSMWDDTSAYTESELNSFVSKIRAIYMRDVYSAAKVRRLRHEYYPSFQGVDCAMLLRRRDNATLPRALPRDLFAKLDGQIAVYFGRSDISVEQIFEVVSRFSTVIGADAFWLPWGSTFAFPQAKKPLFPLPAGIGVGQLKVGDQMHLIEQATVVVTDTYHVCINAWRMGVPAICIGGALGITDWDVNCGRKFACHDKRYALFAMLEALDFFIHEAELDEPEFLNAHLAHIAALLADGEVVEGITAALGEATDFVEGNLVADIEAIFHAKQRRSA